MKNILTAIALAIALPAVAHAQAAPAPAPKADCCASMKDCKCCKDMAGKGPAGHDKKAGADAHGDHDMPHSGADAAAAHGERRSR